MVTPNIQFTVASFTAPDYIDVNYVDAYIREVGYPTVKTLFSESPQSYRFIVRDTSWDYCPEKDTVTQHIVGQKGVVALDNTDSTQTVLDSLSAENITEKSNTRPARGRSGMHYNLPLCFKNSTDTTQAARLLYGVIGNAENRDNPLSEKETLALIEREMNEKAKTSAEVARWNSWCGFAALAHSHINDMVKTATKGDHSIRILPELVPGAFFPMAFFANKHASESVSLMLARELAVFFVEHVERFICVHRFFMEKGGSNEEASVLALLVITDGANRLKGQARSNFKYEDKKPSKWPLPGGLKADSPKLVENLLLNFEQYAKDWSSVRLTDQKNQTWSEEGNLDAWDKRKSDAYTSLAAKLEDQSFDKIRAEVESNFANASFSKSQISTDQFMSNHRVSATA